MKPNTLSELSKPPHERDPRVLRAEEAAHEARERAIDARADKLSDTRSMKDFIFDYGDVLAPKLSALYAAHTRNGDVLHNAQALCERIRQLARAEADNAIPPVSATDVDDYVNRE